MTVYPDNNILVSLEKGALDIARIETAVGSNNLVFPYSPAHLYEADTMEAYETFTKEQLIEKRMNLIDELSKGNFIYLNADNQIHSESIKAMPAYNKINDYPDRSKILKGFQAEMPNAMRKLFRETLGIDPVVLSQLLPAEVVSYLDSRYLAAGLEINFSSTVEAALAALESSDKPASLYDKIAVWFGALDTVGYARDKETERADFARMWDSSHASYAAQFDVFLTNDKRTGKKAELIYNLLGLHTKVVNTNTPTL